MASPEITCGNCAAACCQARTLIRLTRPEVNFLASAGTEFRFIPEVDEGGRVKALLVSKCGWLDDQGLCRVYEDPRRPEACDEFKSGSLGCIDIRLHQDVPTEINLLDVSGEVSQIHPYSEFLLRDFVTPVRMPEDKIDFYSLS